LLEASAWADEKNYTLNIDGIPSPAFATTGATGSFVLSVGKIADGSYAWSDS